MVIAISPCLVQVSARRRCLRTPDQVVAPAPAAAGVRPRLAGAGNYPVAGDFQVSFLGDVEVLRLPWWRARLLVVATVVPTWVGSLPLL